MAQVYNPSTGQWEDDEEDNRPLGGNINPAIGSGPDLSSVFNSNTGSPSTGMDYNNLSAGYQWGLDGYTKKYSDPYATTYDIMNSGGTSIGTGYDTVEDALRKLAFTSGVQYYDPVAGTPGAFGQMEGALPGGWGHSFFGSGGETDWLGNEISPYVNRARYSTQEELYNALLAAPGSPLSLESTEKYGRPIFEQQLQEALGQYLTGVGPSTGVEDWTYHRDATGNQIADNITGLNTLYGSNVLIGPDGQLAGYGMGLYPEGMNVADTSGSVQSNTMLQRQYNPGMANYITPYGDGMGFVNASNAASLPGWQNVDSFDYSKAPSGFDSFMSSAIPMAILGMGAGSLGGLFGEGALGLGGSELLGGGAELLGEAGGYSFLSPEILGAGPELLGGGLDFANLIPGASESLNNLSTGLDSLFNTSGFNSSAFSPDFSALDSFSGSEVLSPASQSIPSSIGSEMFGPPEITDMPGQFLDDFGGGTNAQGEFTNYKGRLSPQDRISTALRQLGMDRNTAASLTKGGGNMYDFLTNPVGGGKAGMFKAPSPLEMLYKGGKGIMDYKSNQDAMSMYEDQLKKATNWTDPNRARGDAANAMWMQNFQNPMGAFSEFMNGPGRAFTDQARAQAARGGRRGSYLNSGKMNSDLMSLFLQNQNQRGNSLKEGFVPGFNNQAAAMQYMEPLAQMERNQYQPIGQAIDAIMRQFQLSDLFGA